MAFDLRSAPDDESDVFSALWRENHTRLRALASRITGSAADADDALQDAFCAAWRARGSFLGESRPSTWLHRITVNACLMQLRRRRRRPTESLEPEVGRLLDESAPDPLAALLDEERQAALRGALARLSDVDRAVVLSSGHDEAHGISRGAWKSRRFRVRRHLKNALFAAGALS